MNDRFNSVHCICISSDPNYDDFLWNDKRYLGLLVGEISKHFDAKLMLEEYWMIIAYMHHHLQSPFYVDTDGLGPMVKFGNGSGFLFNGSTIELSLVLSESEDAKVYGWSERFVSEVWLESKRKLELSNPNVFEHLARFAEWVRHFHTKMTTHQPILEPPRFLEEVLRQYQCQ